MSLETCEYCSDGKRTGLPGNACENCMNTGLKYPEGMNTDLPKHAAAKVKRALEDVYQLTSDPAEMLRISILASGICIGQAAGILSGMMKNGGATVSEAESKQEILRLITITVMQGGAAAWQSLEQSPQERADG